MDQSCETRLCVPAWLFHKRLVAFRVFIFAFMRMFVNFHDVHAGTMVVFLNRHCQSMSATVLRELQGNMAACIEYAYLICWCARRMRSMAENVLEEPTC